MVDEVDEETVGLAQADPEAGAEDELSRLQAENAALREQALRYAAEAENTRRRAEREANDARAFAIQRFARDLLDAVSNFVLGVEMTEKALQTAFERNGLKRVFPSQGERFDPNLHQAMMEQPAPDVAPSSVVQVMQAGYELLGRLVRPAMVIVTPKGPSGAPASDGQAYAAPEDPQTGGSVDQKA
jgi:molecular chaperone GrpE